MKTPVLTLRKPPVRELDAFVGQSREAPAEVAAPERHGVVTSQRHVRAVDAPERPGAVTSGPGNDDACGDVSTSRTSDVVASSRPSVMTSQPRAADVAASRRADAATSERPGVVTSQARWKPSRLRRDLREEDRERLTCWLPRDLAVRLRRAAADQRRAQADLVSEALERLLSS